MRSIQKWRKRFVARLGPVRLGIAEALYSFLGVCAGFGLAVWGFGLSDPSAETFRLLAQIEAAIFIAYTVTIATTGPKTSDKGHSRWLALTCTIGFMGFLGVLTSVGMAAYLEAGNSGTLDIVGLCLVVPSLLLLGGVIALSPAIAASWRDPDPS